MHGLSNRLQDRHSHHHQRTIQTISHLNQKKLQHFRQPPLPPIGKVSVSNMTHQNKQQSDGKV
jgi:hypothetical protein